MTARVIPFRSRSTPTSSELTSEQLFERASRLERDPLRATQSATEARKYVEAAIRHVEASTAGTPEHRTEAVEALRDGLALMALGLGHVIEERLRGGAWSTCSPEELTSAELGDVRAYVRSEGLSADPRVEAVRIGVGGTVVTWREGARP